MFWINSFSDSVLLSRSLSDRTSQNFWFSTIFICFNVLDTFFFHAFWRRNIWIFFICLILSFLHFSRFVINITSLKLFCFHLLRWDISLNHNCLLFFKIYWIISSVFHLSSSIWILAWHFYYFSWFFSIVIYCTDINVSFIFTSFLQSIYHCYSSKAMLHATIPVTFVVATVSPIHLSITMS